MPHHAHATMRALELVVAVVDATTAMEVVEALRLISGTRRNSCTRWARR